MKKISVTFEHEGNNVKLEAVMNERYFELSKASIQKGIEFYRNDSNWPMYFPCDGQYDYELRGGYRDDNNMYIDYVAPWNKETDRFEIDIFDVVDNFK